MFIVSNSPKRKIPWPDADDGEHERVVLHEDLLRIYNDSLERGVITLTPGAFNTFKGWYNKRKRSQDVFKQSFEAREDAHVLRVAALLCVNDDSWRIDVHHLQRATQLVAELKETSSTIFESAELRTKFASALDTIRSTLISAGMDPVPRGRLYMRCRSFVDNVEFLSLLEVLHEVGAVQRFEVRHDGAGRPIDFIRGTQLLLARGLGEQVMERFS
jgi:hypothetical protein